MYLGHLYHANVTVRSLTVLSYHHKRVFFLCVCFVRGDYRLLQAAPLCVKVS